MLEAEPAAEPEPGLQLEHTEAALAPVAADAVPAAHATGAAPPPGQYQPWGHVTAFDVALPLQRMPALQIAGAMSGGQDQPFGHATELFVAPPLQKMPAEQLEHKEAPGSE